MSSVNRVILVGRLGQDPKLKATQSGQSVCEMSLATEEQWTDKGSGERQKRTDWHNIVAWGRTGEVAAEHLTKGRQVYIEGKLQTRSWEKDGQKHFRTEIVAAPGAQADRHPERELQLLQARHGHTFGLV